MVCAGGGVGLALCTGAGAASASDAAAADTLRTLLTRSVSRDTERQPSRTDEWMGGRAAVMEVECRRAN